MGMDKQNRLIMEKLGKIEEKLAEITGGTVLAELEATEVNLDLPQLTSIEAKLDLLIGLLTPSAQAGAEAATGVSAGKGNTDAGGEIVGGTKPDKPKAS